MAAALASLVALQIFYIAGLDGVPKLIVLVGTAILNVVLFRFLRQQIGEPSR